MKLLAFAASHRKTSVNRKLVKLASDMAASQGAKPDLVEYGDYDMPIYDNETYDKKPLPEVTERFIAHVRGCDGFIIASPEYNWSFPGSLKNMIDWASTAKPNPFAGKTAFLLSASPSLRGGAQGLIHLKVPLEALGVYVYPRHFVLGKADEAFEANGAFKDTKLTVELTQMVAQFVAMTLALAKA